MTELSRTSALASRHRELGSGLEDWNDMGTAWSYNTNPNDEHDAVRETAGMFDMSPLKKVYLRGPDAAAAANHVITRDLNSVKPGQSAYGAVLTDTGTVCDDAIVANNGNDEWLLCHGSGASMARIQESAQGKNVDVEFDDDLHNLSLQGPKALALLNAHTNIELADMKYFNHQACELFGHACRLSRTGYSGERGYEILAPSSAIGDIWDQIIGTGTEQGIMPASFTALDKVRVEAALLFYGYDMTDEHTPWEVGLGFSINRSSDYRGKDAAMASKGKERFTQAGISIDHHDCLIGGEILRLDGQDVGTLNSPAFSHRLNKSLALAHISPATNVAGNKLEVVGEDVTYSAVVENIPFFDNSKSRTHA
jgi:aminomethyltransferase